jgi:hypothetical protein
MEKLKERKREVEDMISNAINGFEKAFNVSVIAIGHNKIDVTEMSDERKKYIHEISLFLDI